MRIGIIGINYSPEQTGIGPYTTGLAEHLASSGHEVTVLTGLPSYPEWRVDDRYKGFWRRCDRENGVTIVRHWHYVPRTQSALRRIAYELSFAVCVLYSAISLSVDVLIAVVPSLSGGVIARVVGTLRRCPYGVWFQDFMGAAVRQSGLPSRGPYALIATAVEGWIARGASKNATILERGHDVLQSLGVDRSRITRVRNWTRDVVEPFPGTLKNSFQLEPGFVIAHSGNMGFKQGLETVIRCAQLAEREDWCFWLIGDGSRRRALETLTRQLRLKNVRFIDLLPVDQMRAALQRADVLLIVQKGTVLDMSLPSKITTYFAQSKPVIGSIALHSETAAELAASNGAVIIPPDNPAALFDAIKLLQTDSTLRCRLAQNGAVFAHTYLTSEACLRKLADFVASAAN